MLCRLFQAFEEAVFLLLFRDVQEEFAYDHPVARQVVFEIADVFVALLPEVLSEEHARELLFFDELRMHTDHEHFLVVRTVEYADAAAVGQDLHAAPEVVVVEVLAGWGFE